MLLTSCSVSACLVTDLCVVDKLCKSLSTDILVDWYLIQNFQPKWIYFHSYIHASTDKIELSTVA